jgi:hypothetical protein
MGGRPSRNVAGPVFSSQEKETNGAIMVSKERTYSPGSLIRGFYKVNKCFSSA